MTDEELIAMARLAQRDDRMSTGALYGDLADRIEELDRACSEWADASQANYQRAKTAEAKLAKAVESLGRSKYRTATMSQAAIKAINEFMLEKRRADDAEDKLEKLVIGAETVLEEWDRGDEAAFREAIEEMREDVEEAKEGMT